MAPKRILILTLSFGTGHVVASSAIADAIRRQDTTAEVRTIDCIVWGSALFRAFYVWPYWMMIRYAPSLWARLLRSRHEHFHQQTAPQWFFRWGCARVFRQIRQWNPDVLVATEVGACEIASMARQRCLTTARLIAVATDHESEPVWVKDEVDEYHVPTRDVARQLTEWGVRADRIRLSGIPVLKKFHGGDRGSNAKTVSGFPEDRPLVLIMGGGMGPLRMDEIVRQLARTARPLTLVAVAGLNTRMRRRLERMQSGIAAPVQLKVMGWTDRVDELMRAADVLVTKPGGLTLTEAACMGLPMVCVNPIPGPEEVHCQLLEREGLGVVARSLEDVASCVVRQLSHTGSGRTSPPWLKANAAERIAQSALQSDLRRDRDAVFHRDEDNVAAFFANSAPLLRK